MANTEVQQHDQDGQPVAAWTVGRLLGWTAAWFERKNVEGGRLAAELLLARALGCRKIDLYTRFEHEPTDQQRADFRELVRRAAEHTPIAYLLGSREFFSLAFEVSPAVLIPRPETEALVQRMVDLCRLEPARTWRILDLGTGSGCIAVAVARYAANAVIVAADISAEAVEVASRNISQHGLGERVRPVVADCVALPAEMVPPGGFDAIVCNPPYVSAADWEQLPAHIREHEPRIALTLDGSDGLVMYRRLADEAPAVLGTGGRLLVEIGCGQQPAVRELFAAAGRWDFVGSYRDPTDPHERVIEFALP